MTAEPQRTDAYLTPEGRARARSASYLLPDPGGEVVRDLLDLIDRLDQPHMIQVRPTGWEILHAIACRTDMLGCPVHVACVEAGWTEPPVSPGRYLVEVVDGEPVLTGPTEVESRG